jgi:sugar/nucleoside kinase (ribokinase family)
VITIVAREGVLITTRDGKISIPPAQPEAEIDPVGDALRAGLAYALLRGQDIEAAGRIAVLAAVYVAERRAGSSRTMRSTRHAPMPFAPHDVPPGAGHPPKGDGRLDKPPAR